MEIPYNGNICFDHLYFDFYTESLRNIHFVSAKMLETPYLKPNISFVPIWYAV